LEALTGFHLLLADAKVGSRVITANPSLIDAMLALLIDECLSPIVIAPDGNVDPGSFLYSVLDDLSRWSESSDETTRNVGRRYLAAWREMLAMSDPGQVLGIRSRPPSSAPKGQEEIGLPTVVAPSGATYEQLLEELHRLVGLTDVKKQVLSEIDGQLANAERRRRGLPVVKPNRHMIFSGNPGTGKTTVARIIGEIYHQAGILSGGHLVEVGPGDLLGRFQGSNTQRIQATIELAVGGVLLIDEAYTLAGTDRGPMEFQQQVIDTLVKGMEDNRDDLVVIFTGYSEPMDRFIASNAGLESRIGERVHFPDYTNGELLEVFSRLLVTYQMNVDDPALTELQMILEGIHRNERFGNARLMRNIFEDCVGALNRRIASADLPSLPTEELNGISLHDVLEVKEDIETGRANERRPVSIGFIP
jgi:Holliday junction resolvasome RuvABC ATP-dependent DNA helicase subunit